MLIAKISVRNFRAFGPKGIELDAEQLNILIGRNGSGKSSLLCALDHSRLHALADAAERRNDPDAAEMAHDAINRHRVSHATQINIATRLEQHDCDATINIADGKRQVNLPFAVGTDRRHARNPLPARPPTRRHPTVAVLSRIRQPHD